MLLTQDQKLIRDAVRTFVANEIAPKAAQWDRDGTFPAEALKGLAQLGCYGVAVPEQWGGAGLNYVSLALILEEVAAGDGATSTVISVNNCPVCSIMMAWANDAQKQRWLVPLARGEMLGAFCLTEPHVGSEAGGLRTTARRDGDHTCSTAPSSSSRRARTPTSPSSWRSPTRPRASAAFPPSWCPPARPATWSRGSSARWGSMRRTPRRSCSRTAGCRRRICSAKRARDSRSRCQGWRAAASASPRRAWAWRVRLSRRRCATRRSAWPSARRSSTTRRCSSGWPTWPRRSRPRGS